LDLHALTPKGVGGFIGTPIRDRVSQMLACVYFVLKKLTSEQKYM
jgi:hypothetical protein